MASLFADDTTVIGKAREIDEVTQVMKENLALFEERTNDTKEERVRLGTMEANNIRMLGVYFGGKEDISQQLRREALIFARFLGKIPNIQENILGPTLTAW